MEEEKKTTNKRIYGIIGLSCILALGVTFQILGCALPGENWWPLFGAPIPSTIGGIATKRLGGNNSPIFNSTDNRHLFWVDLGLFTSTFLLISGLALPIVFFHSAVITLTALILSECGGIIVYVAISAFIFFFLSPPKEPEFI